ncbi:UNKNOWN [Stylonychia lemnae]|uniref:NADP-dependent oxidoreductase domain-containing protein n=1 Tax=Stylonychia lemnae TaxID=5949 RepID=A0A078A7J5_STYLE|nr:UNKNOWN [Stylonychia lemnae]|eukprot:CDW78225.1 UNKNOWN [Stylonychia lemnae]
MKICQKLLQKQFKSKFPFKQFPIINEVSLRQYFWGSKQPQMQAKLIDSEQELKIDRYRGQLQDFIQNFEKFEEYLEDTQNKFDLKKDVPVQGFCTVEGTQRFKQRASTQNGRLGSYLGAPDDATDFDLYNAMKLLVLSGGVNVIDTAINYRCQKSERTFGAALKTLIRKYGINRDELFICTKNGYIPIKPEDVANGIHCMHPAFLENQFNQSRNNLGVEAIDLMYIHNSYESWSLYYGMATWLCFRGKPDEEKINLNLQKCIEMAEQIGGKENHNFKFIQVPMGVAMPEAFVEKWQEFHDPNSANAQSELKILVAVCNLLKMNLIASKPILEGKIESTTIPQITNIKDTVAKHLQLVRSMPIRCHISTLVGMKKMENLKKNFEVIKNEPLTKEEFLRIMKLK